MRDLVSKNKVAIYWGRHQTDSKLGPPHACTHRNIRTYLSHTTQIEIKVEKWWRSNSSPPDSLLTHICRGEFLEVMPSKGCGWGREQLRCWLHKSPMWEPFLIQNYCIDVLAKSSALFQPAWWLIFNLTEEKKNETGRGSPEAGRQPLNTQPLTYQPSHLRCTMEIKASPHLQSKLIYWTRGYILLSVR